MLSKTSRIGSVVGLTALLALGCAKGVDTDGMTRADVGSRLTETVIDLDAKRPNDLREERVVTLPNGLTALLISDPSLQKSSAALDVAVGGMEDPIEDEGQAHFLEHMLFLGTEKYPDVEAYSTYITQNQGSSNAYTAADRTNYQFEINHDALQGALDRFGQFFIAPLFTAEYVEREMNAVNSEHQKNLQNDFWRRRMIERHLHRDGHPRQRFSTGSLETLDGLDRAKMVEFYERYYSANVMKLCVMSVEDLDTLEAWVSEIFTAVPNHDRAEITYPGDVFAASDLPRLIQVRPVADERQLVLTFPMPSMLDEWTKKPQVLLGSLIGHEGDGSLLSQLKAENLATGLGTGAQDETWATYFRVTIQLTEEGRNDVDRVIERFFAYVDMLEREGLKEYYFVEEKTMSELNYYFRDHQEGMWTASSYAASMQFYPPEELDRASYLIQEYDPELFASMLEHVRPENLSAMLVAKDVETDTVEKYYGAEYGVRKFTADEVARWQKPEMMAALHYPDPNPFIPDDLTLLANDMHDEPYPLVDDERGIFWFEQDKKFQLPKARVSILLQSDEINASPRSRILATLYARAINESLNEWNYPVAEAGLSASVDDESRGIRLRFYGYSQRIPELMRSFSERIHQITIDETTYASLRDDLAREYQNNAFDQAFWQAFYEYNWIKSARAIHRDTYKDLVQEITLDEVKAFAATVLDQASIEGVGYGNLDPATLRASIDDLFGEVSDEILPVSDRMPVTEEIDLPEGNAFAHVISSKNDNNCWLGLVQLGERSPRSEAIARVGAAAIETPFYSEMRTNQQLGYAVFSGASTSGDGHWLYFLIQSGDYSATEVRDRAHAWMDEAIPGLAEMSDEEFEALKASVITALRQEDTDMAERLGTISYEALTLGGVFDHDDLVVREVEALTKTEMAEAFAAAMAPETGARLAVYHDAVDADRSVPEETLIEDAAAWKRSLPTFQPDLASLTP